MNSNNKGNMVEQPWFKEFKRYVESMPNVTTELPEKSLRTIERERAAQCQ